MSTNFRNIYTQWAQKQALLSFVMKSARCWAGYEPVPGKAPYSNDSCRPKGSKKPEAKKKPAAEKQAVNPVARPPAAVAPTPALRKGANASMPEHAAGEPTTQIKPKPIKTTHKKTIVTDDLSQFGAHIKAANRYLCG